MDWETAIYELKQINLNHLGENSLRKLSGELEDSLKKVKEEMQNRMMNTPAAKSSGFKRVELKND
jgi:hypothetical protein